MGKNSTSIPRDELVPEYYFRIVTTPIHGSNRTVTCDNWYTTIPLLKRMLTDPYQLTITGTIKKNKREIPPQLKIASKTPPSTTFCYTPDITLLSYTPKKKKRSNKFVLLASTYMRTSEVTNDKPNIIHHYNATKGGTDTYDKLCHSYSVTRRTNRWPMRYFYGVLDQAGVHTRILKKLKMKQNNDNQKLTAINVLDELCMYLMKPFLQERYKSTSVHRAVKIGIESILQSDTPTLRNYERVKLDTRQRCAYCKRSDDKKTKEGCASCLRPICETHHLRFCTDCVGE